MHQTPVKVLLIEDQQSDYEIVRLMLGSIESQQFDLDWLWESEAGREALLKGEHDVCLLDYNLGIDNGIAMLRDCKKRDSQMSVILLTACSEYRIDVEAMCAGAADFIVKDQLTPALLERSIRYATERGRGISVIRFMQEIAAAANEAASTADAIQVALDLFCGFAKWQVGHAFMVDGVNPGQKKLLSTNVWSFDSPDRYKLFRQATEEKCGAMPLDALTAVLSTPEPVMLSEFDGSTGFTRLPQAGDCGLTSYFALPVSTRDSDGPIAVLEFLSAAPMRSDETFLKTASFVAQQLAHVFKRESAAAELRRSEIRLRSIVQSATDAIVLMDAGGKIISWNKGAERMFGYSEHEILGFPMELLMPEGYRNWHRGGIERQRTLGSSPVVGKTVELEGLRKDGTDFPIELSLASWTAADGTFFTGIIRDITERWRSDRRIA